MPNTDQNDSPPSLNPQDHNSDQPENQPSEVADLTADTRDNSIDGDQEVGMRRADEAADEVRTDSINEDQEGSDASYSDEAEMERFVEVNGGSPGQLHTPEEASEERKAALDSVRNRVETALQAFRKITKQSHIADRLLGCLTPTASMPDRLPFTPVSSLKLASQNRDDHILHIAGTTIEAWGLLVRGEWDASRGPDGFESLDSLRARVTRLEDVVHDRRLFKAYPVTPRSSLFILRRVTDQAKLNEKAAAEEAERAERLD